MAGIIVNQVLSSDIESGIFRDLLTRISASAPPDIDIRISKRPLGGRTIPHFHRPHLEWRLPANAVTTIHHDPADKDGWFRFEKFRSRYREATVNVCLNSNQKTFLAGHGIDNCVVIPHGFDPVVLGSVERPKRHDGVRPVVLGIFSRRYTRPVKGEGNLYALLKHLPRDRCSFLFVGRDRWRDVGVARAFGFAAEVYETVPYHLFGELYSRIDLLLIPSLFEGGPACLPEALGAATPVLATRTGMAVDMIRDGRNGLFLTGDAHVDASRISGLLDDNARPLNALFDAAAACAHETPSWADSFRRLFDLYRCLAAGECCTSATAG